MNNYIDIGTKINLQDLLASRLLIQANSGGGKSAIARVIMEKTYGKVPFMVMDFDGEYYTLKEKFGDVLVIGGQYADVPISMKSAKLLPREIIANGLSVVIDLSDLKTDERILYAKYFLESLMDLPKQFWLSYLVFIEEAHKLCGQQDMHASGPAVKDLMSRGRKMGCCGVLLTQRISKLHKDAAAECNNKFIGRTFLDLDMNRAGDELGFSNKNDKLILRDLKPGHFYAFGTSIEPHHVHEVTIEMPQTKMPKAGTIMDIKPQKPTDKLKATLAKLNDLPQEAAKELKNLDDAHKEIARLRKEVAAKQTKPAVGMPSPKDANQLELAKTAMKQMIERNGQLMQDGKAKDSLIANLKKAIGIYEKRMTDYHGQLVKIAEKLTDSHGIKLDTIIARPTTTVTVNSQGKIMEDNHLPLTRKASPSTQTNGSLPPGERAVLIACAQYGHSLKRDQLTVLTGYKKSSRDSYIARLKEKGFIRQDGEKVEASEEGINYLGEDFERLPTGEDLQMYWLNRLPPGEKATLEVLIEHYPEPVSRDLISEKTNYMKSSRDAYIARMAAKELIVITGPGALRASANLFDY